MKTTIFFLFLALFMNTVWTMRAQSEEILVKPLSISLGEKESHSLGLLLTKSGVQGLALKKEGQSEKVSISSLSIESHQMNLSTEVAGEFSTCRYQDDGDISTLTKSKSITDGQSFSPDLSPCHSVRKIFLDLEKKNDYQIVEIKQVECSSRFEKGTGYFSKSKVIYSCQAELLIVE
jgi:hypothetical protein